MLDLRLDNVSCAYDSHPILDGIKFSCKPNDFIGIVGPNGSGKTTLLRVISRVLRPAEGSVTVDGQDPYLIEPIELAKKLAVVPQDSLVSFDFTALEVVMMGRNPHIESFKMEGPRDLQIAKHAMEQTKCLSLAERKMSELSGGERRMVIIARALAQEPKILLLDEPTLNLDVSHQIELMDTVKNFCKKKGLIVLSVFHDFNLASRYSDYLLMLSQGKLFSVGTPEEVFTKETIQDVFNVKTEITNHPVTRLNITVLSPGRGIRRSVKSSK
ncbi:MAG: ABC transporter ATP-binding protein [Nitrososphaerales archaeon]